MRWVEQPAGSDLCGQVAVAVVTGLDLEDTIEYGFEGHRGPTNTRRVVAALRRLEFECGDKLRRWRRPEVGIAKLSWRSLRHISDWHWVVVDGDRVWDGIYGDDSGAVSWPRGSALTSYLWVSVSSRDSASTCVLLP